MKSIRLLSIILAITVVVCLLSSCFGDDVVEESTTSVSQSTTDSESMTADIVYTTVIENTTVVTTDPQTTAVVESSAPAAEVQTTASAEHTTTTVEKVTAAAAQIMTTDEIIEYFNAGANNVKYNAKKIVRNYTETRNNEKYLELPAVVSSIAKLAMKQFMKRDDTKQVWTSRDDFKIGFPVGNQDWVSKLTASDVSNAAITDDGNTYTIILTFGSEENPVVGKGYGAVFGVLTADVVSFDYPGLSLSDQSFLYYDGKITATFDKATGNLITANYNYPVIISLTAHILGKNTPIKVGMTTINDYTVSY